MMKRYVLFAVLVVASIQLRCRGPVGPTGPPGPPGGGGVESLTNPLIQPRVLYTFPAANSVGPYAAPPDGFFQMEIRFNKIMERASTIRAISLSSPHTKAYIDSTRIYSLGDDVWWLYPSDSGRGYYDFRWRVAETYTLGVSQTAKDINGNLLLPAYSMTFEPEPVFRVINMYPGPGATNIMKGDPITIYFNSPLDTSSLSRIHLSPAVRGGWEYPAYDSTQLYFESFGLDLNTTYTITIDASAQDRFGHPLPNGFSSSFTTAAFGVSSSWPQAGARDVDPNSSISVWFTSGIDTGTARSSFSIEPKIPGYITPGYYGSISFQPAPSLQPSTLYTVTIDTSIRGENGEELTARYQFSFTTAPFQVESTYPYDNQSEVSRTQTILVWFNTPIDTSTVRSAFMLADSNGTAVTGSVAYNGNQNPVYSFAFTPAPPLAREVIYTATIGTSLRTYSGVHLARSYSFEFKTGP